MILGEKFEAGMSKGRRFLSFFDRCKFFFLLTAIPMGIPVVGGATTLPINPLRGAEQLGEKKETKTRVNGGLRARI